MNLKDILNPETCLECKFFYREIEACKLGLIGYKFLYEGFDYCTTIHKDCPLLRIKCENCSRYVPEVSKPEDNEYYCLDRCWADVPCIEFEEVR